MSAASPERNVYVHLLPDLVHPHSLAGHWVVVVDVLRASSVLTAAMDAAVGPVLPCLEVAEARQLAKRREQQGDTVLLGGERNGRRIDGFDLGNSPSEYTSDRVRDRTLVFTTTNGTRAMTRCLGASCVLIGCFANLSRLLAILQATAPAQIHIVCAGTHGEVSWEDTLFAGALVTRLRQSAWDVQQDAAVLAESAWQQIQGDQLPPRGLAEAFCCGRGGQNLMAIDRADDVRWAATIDRSQMVPQLDLSDWAIRCCELAGAWPRTA